MKLLTTILLIIACSSALAIPATEKYVDEAIKENNVKIDVKLSDKIDFPKPFVPTDYVLTKTDTGIAWLEQKGGGGGGSGGSLGPISYISDASGHKYRVMAMINPAGQIVAAVEQVATNVVLMTVEQERDRATIAEGEMKVSISNEVVRATEIETDLDERINSISAVGRFLSTWDCKTGKPGTEPKESVLVYKAGDYYIVGSVSASITNYIPSGTIYTNGTTATAFTTNTVSINDLFRHTDDGSWTHISMAGVTTTFSLISGDPRDNTRLAAEFAFTDEAISNLVLEINRSYTADTNMLALIESETNRAHVAEANLMSDLVAETNRAQIAETDLNTRLISETNRAQVAEWTISTNLLQQINNEMTRATNAEWIIIGDLVSETNRAKTAEQNIELMVNVETNRARVAETDIDTRLISETNRAQVAEYTISTNVLKIIEDEIIRATNEETRISTELVAETNRAQIAETDLDTRLVSETNRAQIAEHDLGDRIDEEDARAQLAEQELDTRLISETNRSIQADNYIIGIATNKQNKLPNPINGKFLHANEVSGNLEWADAGGITSGFVEEGGKKLQIDPPVGYDTRDLLRADNYSKGYQVGHYKATLTALESPTGSAVLGYYKVTDLGDGDAFIEAVMKNGLVYFCSRQGGTWSSWTCPSKQTALDVAHPVNSIWIQYTNDDAPSTLFNGNGISSTWTDVTANYASRFFKADPYLAVGTLETESLPKPELAWSGNHNHTRGTMNITGQIGVWRYYSIEETSANIKGAFYKYTSDNQKASSYGSTEKATYGAYFDASRTWTGNTSDGGNHTHAVNTSGPYGDNYSVKPLTSTVKIWKRTN